MKNVDYIIEKREEFPEKLCGIDSIIAQSLPGKGIHQNNYTSSSDMDKEAEEILDCYNHHYDK